MKQSVFINRTINLKKIKYIGLDMDHTLIRYHTKEFETLVYQFVIEYLIKHKQYPTEIRDFHFHFESAIRGTVVDSKNGNILKLHRNGNLAGEQLEMVSLSYVYENKKNNYLRNTNRVRAVYDKLFISGD